MERYLSELGKRLKKPGIKSMKEKEILIERAEPKDTRNLPLQELDKPAEEINKWISNERAGEFNPKEESNLEDKAEKMLKKSKLSPSKKLEYLSILAKRKRTA